MIGYLSGTVFSKYNDSCIVLVGGVGYLVYLAPSTLSNLSLRDSVNVRTYTHVKEESLELYGFLTEDEHILFKLLLSVSGIGAKTSLLVIDRGVNDVKNAIATANLDFFTMIPRLGKKNAQKIIIELKNKVGAIAELDLSEDTSFSLEISDALASMGYSRPEIKEALKKIPSEAITTEDRLRHALRALAKG